MRRFIRDVPLVISTLLKNSRKQISKTSKLNDSNTTEYIISQTSCVTAPSPAANQKNHKKLHYHKVLTKSNYSRPAAALFTENVKFATFERKLFKLGAQAEEEKEDTSFMQIKKLFNRV